MTSGFSAAMSFFFKCCLEEAKFPIKFSVLHTCLVFNNEIASSKSSTVINSVTYYSVAVGLHLGSYVGSNAAPGHRRSEGAETSRG